MLSLGGASPTQFEGATPGVGGGWGGAGGGWRGTRVGGTSR